MFALTALFAVVLAVAFAAAGAGKLAGSARVTEVMEHVGVRPPLRGAIGVLEVVAAVGLLIGLWVEWLGVLTSIALVLLMAGAIVFHLRVDDRTRRIVAPAVLLALSLLELIFRSVTAS